MNKYTAAFLAGTITTILACSTPKKGYEFPEAMSATVRAGFTEQCNKGKVLYELSCAKCHNIKKGKKEIVPDFTTEQLIGYELRVKNPQHESNIPETTVSAEELGLICTYLTYKSKSSHPATAGKRASS